MFAYERETIPQEQAGKEGAKVLCAVFLHAANDLQPGKILPQIDANIGKVFIVLEQNIILRLEFLDQVGFQRKRFGLVCDADILKVRNLPHHSRDLRRVIFGRLKILTNPIFQRYRFSNVNDLTRGIKHLVNAG